MHPASFIFTLCLTCAGLPSCDTQPANATESNIQTDTARPTRGVVQTQFNVPDTVHPTIMWKVFRDSLRDPGTFSAFVNQDVDESEQITSFRSGQFRQSASRGRLKGAPVGVKLDWTFKTRISAVEAGNDGSKYSKINWGGGSGWTGQPSLIRWSRAMKDSLDIKDSFFLRNDQARELIIGSLTGEVYFLDFATGKPTRQPFAIDGPIKGSIAVDPRLNGMLYVGQGIPKGKRFGAYLIDMTKRKINLHLPGIDADASRGWGAFDSNPLLEKSSGTLFWPSENGLIYRINVQDKEHPFVQSKLKYSRPGMSRLGLEASMAAIGSYGFFADNSGNILCVDLRLMKPLWLFDNQDDTDASIAVDQQDDQYFLYVGNEVDHRQPQALSTLRKIDASSGRLVWEVGRLCTGTLLDGKENSGGILATPLIGKHKGSDIVAAIFSRTDQSRKAELVAVDKATGKERYRFTLDAYTWASPVDIYDQHGNMYIFFSDVAGRLYILDGQTGKLLVKTTTGQSMESSPIVFDDRIVVGTRGNSILSFKIQTGN